MNGSHPVDHKVRGVQLFDGMTRIEAASLRKVSIPD